MNAEVINTEARADLRALILEQFCEPDDPVGAFNSFWEMMSENHCGGYDGFRARFENELGKEVLKEVYKEVLQEISELI